jgi:type IV secretion system protein TrbF
MEGSVYLKAREEWDERYANLVLGKRNWQITAAGMMAITLVLAFGMVWVSTRSKFVPYVVEIDQLGYAIGAPSALTENTTRISTDRMVRYELAAFIRNAREVITDPAAGYRERAAGEVLQFQDRTAAESASEIQDDGTHDLRSCR